MTGDPLDLAALGARIRKARKNAGLTVALLAAKAGVNPASLRMYEMGQRDPGTGGLLAVSRALGVPAGWFLGETQGLSPETRRAAEALAELLKAAGNG